MICFASLTGVSPLSSTLHAITNASDAPVLTFETVTPCMGDLANEPITGNPGLGLGAGRGPGRLGRFPPVGRGPGLTRAGRGRADDPVCGFGRGRGVRFADDCTLADADGLSLAESSMDAACLSSYIATLNEYSPMLRGRPRRIRTRPPPIIP